ncbi:MAG: iron ABC transporter permease [Myxococcaceae bacterium]|nr:iron ABC transporter permease [Myxococcaceae bacterium]
MTRARIAGVLGALAVATLIALALSATFGQFPISLSRVLSDPSSQDANIFWELRVPRALLAVIVGLALGTSGCVLQGLLRNPLADPFVLGVSGGAALGATLALAVGLASVGALVGGSVGEAIGKVSAPSLFAFLGSLGATALVFAAGKVGGRTTPYAALLSGVIFNAFASAAITCIKTLSAPERVGEILYWLAGTLTYERYPTLGIAAVLQAVAVGTMWAYAGRLNLLTLGDDDAASLGVPVERTRMILLLAASLSVAGAVALSGLVGFVGLIVPHVLRLWLGPDQRLLLPASAIGGAGFLALSDLLARVALPVATRVLHPWTPLIQKELPVGVITALLGGPFFLVLLHRRMTRDVPL